MTDEFLVSLAYDKYAMKATSTFHERQKSIPPAILILLVLFVLLFVLFTYTFLHESGHTVIGLLFGQTLTEFNVNFLGLDAHVGMMGKLTQSQLVIQSMSGAGLPFLIWFMFILFAPRKASFNLEILKFLSSMAVLNTLLAWMVIPIFYVFGNAPPDDVTNFLRYSQIPPLLLTFTALLLYVCGWVLFLSKTEGLRNEFLLFRTTDREMILAGTRRTVSVMTGILALLILLTFILAASAVESSISPPHDFVPVAQVDLSNRAYSAELLKEFSFEKPTCLCVFIIVHKIDTPYFDLRVTGSNGYSSVVLHGEGYSAYQDYGPWEEILPPGNYQLLLTADQSPGTVSIYGKTR